MRIRLYKPTDRNTPAHVVKLGTVDLYFSYQTMIGACIPGTGKLRIVNSWGPTTGRHFKEFGLDTAPIVTDDELHRAVVEALAEQFNPEHA